MRVRIVHWPHPVLTKGTQPLTQAGVDDDFRDTVANMKALMHDLRGVGLAAPQVGIAKRFMLVCPTGEPGEETVVVNPEVLEQSGEEEMEEGCLSFPQVYATIRRAERIRVRFRDETWAERTMDLDGFMARVFLHEFDHLNGVVFTSRMTPADLARNKARLDDLRRAAG